MQTGTSTLIFQRKLFLYLQDISDLLNVRVLKFSDMWKETKKERKKERKKEIKTERFL
jgi:hypothetical protein